MSRIGLFLNNQIVQFILTSLLSIGAILAAYNIFFLEKNVKSLEVVILSTTSLVEVEQSVAQDINIIYRDESVTSLSVIQVSLENTGNVPVKSVDYERPVSFIFPSQTKVLTASVVESSPIGIQLPIQPILNSAVLTPTRLLNPGDRVIIKILAANFPYLVNAVPFEVDARVVDLSDISVTNAVELTSQEDYPPNLILLIAILSAVLSSFVVSGLLGFVLSHIRLARLSLRSSGLPAHATQNVTPSSSGSRRRQGAVVSLVFWSLILILLCGLAGYGLFAVFQFTIFR